MYDGELLKKAPETAPFLQEEESLCEGEGLLHKDEEGLFLMDESGLKIRGDFTKMLPRLKANNLNGEMLVKAARIKNVSCPVAVDATAGMGEDSLLLAAAGFRVKLFERDPVIAALLADTLRRSAQKPELADIVSRMELTCADSLEELPRLGFVPDVVVLDPMFPGRTKSASVKKKFQLIHQLERPCDTEEELLAAALSCGAHKIVIKRPLKGAYLAGRKPSYSLSGKAIRYDVIERSPPYAFAKLTRGWAGTKAAAHAAGASVDWIRQRYYALYPKLGSRMLDELCTAVARFHCPNR